MKSIRKKGKWKTGEDKLVIEENRKYLKTLPPVEELFKLLCLAEKQGIASQNSPIKVNNEGQNYAYSILTEPEKEVKIKTPTEEERKLLWELTK